MTEQLNTLKDLTEHNGNIAKQKKKMSQQISNASHLLNGRITIYCRTAGGGWYGGNRTTQLIQIDCVKREK
jgi:hypothetical protein